EEYVADVLGHLAKPQLARRKALLGLRFLGDVEVHDDRAVRMSGDEGDDSQQEPALLPGRVACVFHRKALRPTAQHRTNAFGGLVSRRGPVSASPVANLQVVAADGMSGAVDRIDAIQATPG